MMKSLQKYIPQIKMNIETRPILVDLLYDWNLSHSCTNILQLIAHGASNKIEREELQLIDALLEDEILFIHRNSSNAYFRDSRMVLLRPTKSAKFFIETFSISCKFKCDLVIKINALLSINGVNTANTIKRYCEELENIREFVNNELMFDERNALNNSKTA